MIGIYDWERTIRQTVLFDLDLGTDIRASASTDNIALTVDYKAVHDRITEYVQNSSFLLVETLAEEVAQLLMKEFGIAWLRLALTKKGALGKNLAVGLVIERSQPHIQQ